MSRSLSLSRRRTVTPEKFAILKNYLGPRAFFAFNFDQLPFREISSVNGVPGFIFDNIMPSHQVNYDFNLIESSAENLPDFTFKLLPLRHSTLGDLWKLENSEVFFIASCNFVVVFECVPIGNFRFFLAKIIRRFKLQDFKLLRKYARKIQCVRTDKDHNTFRVVLRLGEI